MLLKGDEILLVFLRYPEPGKVKTRLIPALGEVGAAETYRRIAERVVSTVVAIDRRSLLSVAFVEPTECIGQVRSWLGEELDTLGQPSGNLGDRLRYGFSWAFDRGAARVVAIGTDCIELTSEGIEEAFERLRYRDGVLGPASDGGYYLIGLSRPLPEVFLNIPWSSERTGAVTLERFEETGAAVDCLQQLSDIDTWEDLKASGFELPEEII